MNTLFPVKLKEFREAAGYKSQQEFADALGVAQSTVGGWEGGSREPNFAMLLTLSKILSVSVDEFFSDTDPFCIPYFRALRRYCTVAKKNFSEIENYYLSNPAYLSARSENRDFKFPERIEVERILGMRIELALRLGSSKYRTLEQYQDLLEETNYPNASGIPKDAREVADAYLLLPTVEEKNMIRKQLDLCPLEVGSSEAV